MYEQLLVHKEGDLLVRHMLHIQITHIIIGSCYIFLACFPVPITFLFMFFVRCHRLLASKKD